jgi:hypothetical protein
MDQKIQEEYVMKTSIPQPIFMKAIETFGKQEIDVRKVDTTPVYTRPPLTKTRPSILPCVPFPRDRVGIESSQNLLMVEKYREHDRIYTDGSLMDDKVGFAIVTDNRTIKKG